MRLEGIEMRGIRILIKNLVTLKIIRKVVRPVLFKKNSKSIQITKT